jgi:CTP:phosphocholine cytidylyltransferase-like protein
MVRWRMLRIIRPKETSQIAVVTGSKQNKREYLKDKIDELAANSKNRKIRDFYRGINKFERDYQQIGRAHV